VRVSLSEDGKEEKEEEEKEEEEEEGSWPQPLICVDT
jgi:hypothetical protein